MTEERRAACELRLPDAHRFYDNIKANAKGASVIAPNTHKGRTVTICGAGPSLSLIREAKPTGDVWACNSALPTLWDWGVRVTHGVTIDQNLAMLHDAEWGRALPVVYYLSTASHPQVGRHLRDHKRVVKLFHSFLGIPDPEGWTPPSRWKPPTSVQANYEMFLYTTLFKPSIMAGHGLNSVPRAICLAMGMGYDHVTVYGADCAMAPDSPAMPPREQPALYPPWLASLKMYADGRSPNVHGQIAMAEGIIDGRRWHTRPDMVISAVHLLELERGFPFKITLVGDTLPNAMRGKPPEFFDSLPKLSKVGQVDNFGVHAGQVENVGPQEAVA